MSSSNPSKSSTPTIKNGTIKSIKIKLKVPPEILAKFPHKKSTAKSSEASSPAQITNAASPAADIKDENDKPEANGNKTNGDDKQKNGVVKAGVKRDSSALGTAPASKPRSRPGPKRRKIETEDQQPWTVTMTGPGAHRLGPKANQGAINAGLRALDKSGAPCRKWGKRTFNLKTFNGSDWSLHHWTAPPKPEITPDGAENNTPSTVSDNHQASSSNVPSIASHQPGDAKDAVNPASPAVVAASA